MAETVANRGKRVILDALLAAEDLRMLVFTGTQTGANDPDLNFVADLDAVVGIAIHTERIALTGETVTENDASDRAELDSANVVFAASPGVTAQGVAIYAENAGTDATRELVTIHTTNFPQPMDGGLTVNVADLLRLS